ncbi:MAG TPA: DUF3048 domain-containing protein [Clostridiales bacterium]|nr:DUF3048 domain-containing protein [Clostridiales bacterium]
MRKLIMIVVAFLLLLTACGKNNPAPTEEPVETPTPTATPSPTPTVNPYINPLTGLPVDMPIAQKRPIAIMINDIKEALPQCGISSADIIYEVAAEGGITRMLAVFQDVSRAGRIGSVRSTRTYYLDLAQGLDAILLHAGASTYAYEALKIRDNCTNIDGIYDTTIFYRDPNRMSSGYEHSLFTTGELIAENIENYGLCLTHDDDYTCNMKFGMSSSKSGTPAEYIGVKFSYYKMGEFVYNSSDGLYYVSQFDEPHIDGETGEQLAVKNVLILFANHSAIPNDSLMRIEVDLVGTGTGIYAADGKSIKINWSKSSYDSQFEYTLTDGSPLVFAPGTSYINIIESEDNLTIE